MRKIFNFIKTERIKSRKVQNFKLAFSLMEVVVGAMIIAAVFGGLAAIFVNVRRYVSHANRRLVAANLGRQELNRLYEEVRADTWYNTNTTLPLSPNHTEIFAGTNIDNSDYTGNYTVSNVTYTAGAVTANREYRQVTTRINYPQE